MGHIDTSAVVRASVWLPPTGDAIDKINDAIRRVHKKAGGPHVRPHVSLLGGIESTIDDVETKLKKLALRVKPFTIRLTTIDWRDEYFRAFFATVKLTPELEAAKRLAHEVFQMLPPDPFEPHVSLLYGDFDESLKKKLAEELGGRLEVSFSATTVQVVNATADRPVEDWKVLAERRLG
jgi:hypothetical protein